MADKINERDKCGDNFAYTASFYLHLLLMFNDLRWATDLLNLLKRKENNNDDVHHLKSLNGNMLHLHSYYTITFDRLFYNLYRILFDTNVFWESDM